LFSIALEILEDDVKPDVVVVCCGGGGLVSGIAAGIKQSGLTDCRIYAVEPVGCKTINVFNDRKISYSWPISTQKLSFLTYHRI
jgi:threonine dehydratase